MASERPSPWHEHLTEWTEREGDCLIWKGGTDDHGYGSVRWHGRTDRIHRAVYEMETGTPIPPGGVIDHLCHNKPCCDIAHLRLTDQRVNGLNRESGYGDTSQHQGVSLHKATGKWRADVRFDGKQNCLGYFDTEDEAAKAAEAERERIIDRYMRLGSIEVCGCDHRDNG